MKPRKFIFLFSVIVTIIIIILVNLLMPSNEEYLDEYHQTIKFEKYEGEIIRKFFFKKNKGYPAIIIKNRFGEQMILFSYDKSGTYDYIEIGDSIFKEYGDYHVEVKRDSITKRFFLNFNKRK
jgi:hypothetical protein